VTVAFHSPVILDVVDPKGRHTTIGDNILVRDNPDVWAEFRGEAKVLIFPSDLAPNISVHGTAVGSVSIEAVISDANGIAGSPQRWLALPVTTSTNGVLSVTKSSSMLSWDANGTGKPDYVGGPDSDGDGVPDVIDKYPNTPLDAVVNSDGGCLAQIVPLTGNWRNRGEYISAFEKAAKNFVRQGLLTPSEAAAAIKLAGDQYPVTGKPHQPPCVPGKWDHHRKHWNPPSRCENKTDDQPGKDHRK
jgi:hypothetical protein